MNVEYGQEECSHIQHSGMAHCPGLTAREQKFAETCRSVGFSFVGGREQFHDTTIAEQTREIFDNAAKYNHPIPDYLGPRSKGRPLSEMKAEIVN